MADKYRNVLIVEDEATFRSIIARNLRARGVEVAEAEDTRSAFVQLNRRLPDLMLLDLNLPDRSGWDLMRQLKSQGVSVPTIIVSAVRVSQERLDEFRPLAYLPKPFPLEALLRLVGVREESEVA